MSIESERARLYAQKAGKTGSLQELADDNQKLVNENARLTTIIESLVGTQPQPNPVRLILVKNIEKSIYQIMTAAFAANQQQQFAFGLLDEVTNAPVTGSYADGTVASDTPGAATGFVDANGNVFFQAVAPGVANLTASAQATYTNSLGNQVVQQLSTAPVQVTITAVQTADGVQLILTPGPITTLPVNPSV
jgi:hypothetical protein